MLSVHPRGFQSGRSKEVGRIHGDNLIDVKCLNIHPEEMTSFAYMIK